MSFFSRLMAAMCSAIGRIMPLTSPSRLAISLRVRNEIASLDGDVNGMIRPIAEHMAAISRLKKDISRNQTKLDELKTDLLTMTQDLEGNPVKLVYGNDVY